MCSNAVKYNDYTIAGPLGFFDTGSATRAISASIQTIKAS